MSEPLDQLAKALKNRGYSLTKPRRVVFAGLLDSEPQTMHELVARCRQIDRASVYRAVALFEQLGIAQRLPMGWKYKLELMGEFVHHHHHLTCLRCGKIIPLPEDAQLEARLYELAQQQNFTPHDHQLELRGSCAACAARA